MTTGLAILFLSVYSKIGSKCKNKQMGPNETKNILHSEERNENENATYCWEKMFANCISDKESISKRYKSKPHTIQHQKNQLKIS